eukprot:9311670-Pyramimonas_sp.AAC.2
MEVDKRAGALSERQFVQTKYEPRYVTPDQFRDLYVHDILRRQSTSRTGPLVPTELPGDNLSHSRTPRIGQTPRNTRGTRHRHRAAPGDYTPVRGGIARGLHFDQEPLMRAALLLLMMSYRFSSLLVSSTLF